MTADVINLRRARKDKVRQDKERVAAENRATFGRKKSEKESAARDRDRVARELDQAKLSTLDEEGGTP